ncbi:MAG TPA: hypothetical protein VLX61_02965 [Anaerolineales bacterium]|nr:hypothetical protein [Anaerolineales bacterium]
MNLKRYSKQGLLSLFLICAFPVHFWTLLLVLRDMSWAIQRTNAWDAIGLASYGLLYALVECILLFCVVACLGFILPSGWNVDKGIAFLSLLFLLTAAWAMLAQLFFIWNFSLPAWLLKSLAHSAHPLRTLYAGSLVVVVPTILLPVILFIRSSKVVSFMKDLIERVGPLSMLYLFFDLVGFIIVLVRNLA